MSLIHTVRTGERSLFEAWSPQLWFAPYLPVPVKASDGQNVLRSVDDRETNVRKRSLRSAQEKKNKKAKNNHNEVFNRRVSQLIFIRNIALTVAGDHSSSAASAEIKSDCSIKPSFKKKEKKGKKRRVNVKHSLNCSVMCFVSWRCLELKELNTASPWRTANTSPKHETERDSCKCYKARFYNGRNSVQNEF